VYWIVGSFVCKRDACSISVLTLALRVQAEFNLTTPAIELMDKKQQVAPMRRPV
jgi:hypothetical protein